MGTVGTSLRLDSDRTTLIVEFADGSEKRVPLISKEDAEKFSPMGSGLFQDLFGAIYMGVRHRKDFLRDLCAYCRIDDPANELFGGYKFYKAKE